MKEKQKRRQVTLSDSHMEKAKAIGGGERGHSHGIRIALDSYELKDNESSSNEASEDEA